MTRRGSFAAYLDIDHPDVEEFLQIKDIGNPIQNLFFSVCVPDYWMQEMIDGDVEKRKLWARILESRQQKGLPYIFFTDNNNKNKSQIYKDLDLKITHSNLCIVGSDRVVSDRGYLTAKELYDAGGELTLFDGEKAVKSSPMKLREKDAPTYTVTLKNGIQHTITDYHEILTVDKSGNHRKVALKDLKVGDRVVVQQNKGLFGIEDNYDLAYLLGWYQADGTQHEDNVFIDIWENSFDKLDEIQETFNRVYEKYGGNTYRIKNQFGETNATRHIETPKFADAHVRKGSQPKKRLGTKLFTKNNLGFKKGIVPDWIWRSNERTQWRYLQSLLEGDGTVYMNTKSGKGDPIQLCYSSVDLEFIRQLQKLMLNLGLKATIYKGCKAGQRLFPDGKGGSKLYNTKQSYKLAVGNKPDCIKINENTGFLDRKGVKVDPNKEYRNIARGYSVIESIEFHSNQDVYCPTVDSDEHIFVCNGLLTGNCNEISLPDSTDESFVCCLSSMNLELYDEWKDTNAVYYAIYFLDAVMSEFIEKTEDNYYLKNSHNFAKRHRALGLGTLGYHSYFQKHNISFNAPETKVITQEIFGYLRREALRATKALSKIYGPAPIYNEIENYPEHKKQRNTTVMAIAPTTSSSSILGQVSPGIEPYSSNYYKVGLAKGNFIRKNKYLTALLESKGKNTEEVWRQIMLAQGSVQGLDFLTPQEKEVFKTFRELSQRHILVLAQLRQKYIDQGQSLNINIPAEVPVKEVNAMMIDAWKWGIKGLYYQRSSSVAKELLTNIITCSSCES